MMEIVKTAVIFIFYLALLLVATLAILGLRKIVLLLRASLRGRKYVRR